MGRYNRRSNTGWFLIPTIADLDAPTVAEFAAAQPLHDVLASITGFTSQQEDLAVPDVGSTWGKTIPGGETADSSSLTFWSGDDDADLEEEVRAAHVEGESAFIGVVKRSKSATAGQVVDIFPVRIKAINEVHASDNTGAQFMIGYSIYDPPHKGVEIAA